MLIGKRFRLNAGALVVRESEAGRKFTVTVPAGEVLKVVSGPDTNGMLDVLWNGGIAEIFLVDLESRGDEIAEASGAHN